jgi:HD-GYP domain-containing protein (c-di-GMP phosphodiesterase class II)
VKQLPLPARLYLVSVIVTAAALLVFHLPDHPYLLFWVAPLTIASIFLTYYTYKVYIGRLEAQRDVQETSNLHLATIEALAGAIDAKDQMTNAHILRVQYYAVGLAEAVGLPAHEIQGVKTAALLHDIGKLAVSNRILDKPAELTAAEYARVKEHPLFTQWVLERVSCFEELAPLGAAHHERLDGSGYPRGLTADDLTLPMRILAVADVYEALTAARPYRPALEEDEALATIRRDVPGRLDGDAYGALETVIDLPPTA